MIVQNQKLHRAKRRAIARAALEFANEGDTVARGDDAEMLRELELAGVRVVAAGPEAHVV